MCQLTIQGLKVHIFLVSLDISRCYTTSIRMIQYCKIIVFPTKTEKITAQWWSLHVAINARLAEVGHIENIKIRAAK